MSCVTCILLVLSIGNCFAVPGANHIPAYTNTQSTSSYSNTASKGSQSSYQIFGPPTNYGGIGNTASTYINSGHKTQNVHQSPYQEGYSSGASAEPTHGTFNPYGGGLSSYGNPSPGHVPSSGYGSPYNGHRPSPAYQPTHGQPSYGNPGYVNGPTAVPKYGPSERSGYAAPSSHVAPYLSATPSRYQNPTPAPQTSYANGGRYRPSGSGYQAAGKYVQATHQPGAVPPGPQSGTHQPSAVPLNPQVSTYQPRSYPGNGQVATHQPAAIPPQPNAPSQGYGYAYPAQTTHRPTYEPPQPTTQSYNIWTSMGPSYAPNGYPKLTSLPGYTPPKPQVTNAPTPPPRYGNSNPYRVHNPGQVVYAGSVFPVAGDSVRRAASNFGTYGAPSTGTHRRRYPAPSPSPATKISELPQGQCLCPCSPSVTQGSLPGYG